MMQIPEQLIKICADAALRNHQHSLSTVAATTALQAFLSATWAASSAALSIAIRKQVERSGLVARLPTLLAAATYELQDAATDSFSDDTLFSGDAASISSTNSSSGSDGDSAQSYSARSVAELYAESLLDVVTLLQPALLRSDGQINQETVLALLPATMQLARAVMCFTDRSIKHTRLINPQQQQQQQLSEDSALHASGCLGLAAVKASMATFSALISERPGRAVPLEGGSVAPSYSLEVEWSDRAATAAALTTPECMWGLAVMAAIGVFAATGNWKEEDTTGSL